MSDQKDIFELVRERYQKWMVLEHSSGGLPDVKNLSDVDISCTANPIELLHHFPPDSIIETTDEYTLVSLKGYPREVNIYFSPTALIATQHRQLELYLNRHYIELVPQVYALKKYSGLSTEQAWCTVLCITGDCYQQMLDPENIIRLADVKSKEWKDYQEYLLRVS